MGSRWCHGNPSNKGLTHQSTTQYYWFVPCETQYSRKYFYHFQTMDVNNNITFKICYPFPEEWGPNYPKIIVMFRFGCYYAIPLFIIGIFYVLIAKHLIYSASHVPGEMQGAQRQVTVQRFWTSAECKTLLKTFEKLHCWDEFNVCLFLMLKCILWFFFLNNTLRFSSTVHTRVQTIIRLHFE